MSALQSCMGGWSCARRDSCANYHAASELQHPAERLCEIGAERAGPQPIREAPVLFHGFTFSLSRERQTQ